MAKNGIKRRGNGQGSAIRVGVNNWKAIAVVGYKPDGNPIRRTKQGFPTKTKALEYVATLKNQITPQTEKITLKEAYDSWSKTHSASQSTMWCYAGGMKLFESVYYVSLREQSVDRLQQCIDQSSAGVRTKQNAKIVLGLVYKWAEPRGFVPYGMNLANYIKVRGATSESEKRGFTPSELEKLKAHVDDVPFADIIYCHCYLGFRPQALLALKSTDYDEKEKAFRGGIKTEAGKNRIVTVSPKILPLVERLVKRYPEGYPFGIDGKEITLRVYRDRFYKCLELCGIQSSTVHDLTPHSCRHTFATLMKSVKAPDKDKLRLIGHTTVQQMQYYQDVSYEDLRKITDKL